MPRDPGVLARDLLGGTPDEIEPLLVWPDRATYRITAGAQRFVVKTDEDRQTVAREVAGHRRAVAAGVPAPELVAVTDDAFAMRWVDGVPLRDRSTPDAWRDTGAQIRLAHDQGGGPPFGAGFGGYEPAHPSWREFFEVFAARELTCCERELGFPSGDGHRIRAALRAAAPMLDAPHVAWCHGDLQAEHVLVDPVTDGVAAIIDWADHGSGDIGWDVMVLTLDDDSHLDEFLDGYGATDELRRALDERMPLFGVVRLLGEAHWFAQHNFPFDDNLRRATEWRS